MHHGPMIITPPMHEIESNRAEDGKHWTSWPLKRKSLCGYQSLTDRVSNAFYSIQNRYLTLRHSIECANGHERSFEKAKSIYEQLLEWADNLPARLNSVREDLPHVLVLQ